MASSSKAFNQAFVLTIFLVACFAFTGTTHSTLNDNIENEDLVSSTCKKTLYVQLCISSLRSDPRSGSSDLKGLAAIALNLSIAKGVDNLSYIKNLKSEFASNGSQMTFSYLSDCLDVYSDAIQNLQDSVQALNDKSYDTLRSLVSAAMTDSETCEDGFKEVKGFRSPLTEQNKYFSRLCSNFLAITTLD
ncbi:Putative invertase inhibitor [Morus notabilis]|uniref:Putative invertase inhibitor n=1 Tax=Morus notabilis TaxID=981085 RepID=W9S6H9_9ROSA|nr:putative invertase inhibitor [Morus notabilis]EXC13611.1 Putative invertase inhibitor [Morus notabilis]